MQRALNSRLLAAASRPVAQRTCAPARRFYSTDIEPKPSTSSSDKPGVQAGDASVVSKEGPSEAMAKHNPDYNVTVDYRTSRVMDGSEPGQAVPAAVLSGAPVDLQARTVRPTKPATQSGDWHSHHWQMDWDPLSKGHRWENPLIGWQSSADFMQGERMFFKSKEDAIAFAEKQGYEYFVQEPNERRIVPKAYANNFLHSPKKLKMIRTK
ncbi:ndufs4 NADH dehydrogenase Fe-S protein subunit [Diplodia intermedia]|uniref:NADH dehydrogenase [ubiquinone] iron-sulfur protein 4, mitochondrial n=1 Tax=Diplodia intermedia TaxID=856260 RepID=A0ABR3U5A8_9PEZI